MRRDRAMRSQPPRRSPEQRRVRGEPHRIRTDQARMRLAESQTKQIVRQEAAKAANVLERLGPRIPYVDYGFPKEWASLSRVKRWLTLPQDIRNLFTPENIAKAKEDAWVLTGQLYPPELMVSLTEGVEPQEVSNDLAMRWLLMTPEQQDTALKEVREYRQAYYPEVLQHTKAELDKLKAEARRLAEEEAASAGTEVTQEMIN